MPYFIVKKRDGDFVDLFDLEIGRPIHGELLPPKQINFEGTLCNIDSMLPSTFSITRFYSEGRKLVTEDGILLCDISDKMEPLKNTDDIKEGSVIFIY